MNQEPWELYPHIWPSKSKFFVWLRGSLRRAVWNTYPVKLEVLRDAIVPIPDGYTGKTKKFAKCALTGEVIPRRNCQVDHKTGGAPLQNWDDITPFVKHLCARKEDLQVISKDAHKIKSYSEREKISFTEATAIKKAIALIREKKDREWLIKNGITPDKKALNRRNQIVQELLRANLKK